MPPGPLSAASRYSTWDGKRAGVRGLSLTCWSRVQLPLLRYRWQQCVGRCSSVVEQHDLARGLPRRHLSALLSNLILAFGCGPEPVGYQFHDSSHRHKLAYSTTEGRLPCGMASCVITLGNCALSPDSKEVEDELHKIFF